MLVFLLFMWRIKRHICPWYCCPRSKARKWRLSDCERIKKALAHLKSPLAFRWFLYNTDLQLNSLMVMRSHTYIRTKACISGPQLRPPRCYSPFICLSSSASISLQHGKRYMFSMPLPLTQPPDLYSHFYSNHSKTPGKRSKNRKKSVHFHPQHFGFFFSLCVSGGAFVIVRRSTSESVFCFLNTEVLIVKCYLVKFGFVSRWQIILTSLPIGKKCPSSKTEVSAANTN